mgnify:FL=1
MNAIYCFRIKFFCFVFRYVTDGTAAIFVVVSMFMWPQEFPDLCCFRGGCGRVKRSRRQPFITWNELIQKVQWGLLLLIGGGFALADSVKVRFYDCLRDCVVQESS